MVLGTLVCRCLSLCCPSSSLLYPGGVRQKSRSLTSAPNSKYSVTLEYSRVLGSHTHTHGHTHVHTPPCPPLSFLRFWSLLGLSLRLFGLFLRLVSLPQSRAKYSIHFFLLLPFSLALLALLFLFFFLLFLRLFSHLFRSSARAPQSGTVCVCVSTSVTKSFECRGLAAHFSTLANEAREMGG